MRKLFLILTLALVTATWSYADERAARPVTREEAQQIIADKVDIDENLVAHPNAREGWIERNAGEPLIDFLNRIETKYKTFELVRLDISAPVKTNATYEPAVLDYVAKIQVEDARFVDPPMIDANTKEIIDGNHRIEAMKRLGRLTVDVILCYE